MIREVNEAELKRELPKGLINGFSFKAEQKILYIGSAEDAYVDVLHQCGADVSIMDIREINEQESVHPEGVYDVIVCIAYWELLEKTEDLFVFFAKMIRLDGHLLLGMNNRLGIRYFCGDRDPYTERSFDGTEGYKRTYMRQEDVFRGRCYTKSEVCDMLKKAGWKQTKSYSVFSDLQHPSFLVSEDYEIDIDELYSIIPCYNNPDTLFLEEENLYRVLQREGMLQQMANAYLIDCTIDGILSDALWIKTPINSKKENAVVTVLDKTNILIKRAVYPEGEQCVLQMVEFAKQLENRGISVVNGTLQNYKTVQTYLKELMHTDREQFLAELDRFRDLIFQSSEIIKDDKHDGKGAILEHGYFDLTPSNCYYVDGVFVVGPQEFCVSNYPANVLLLRMLRCLYQGDMEMSKRIPMETLLERYGLKEKKELWYKAEWLFLYKNKNQYVLWKYYQKIQKNANALNSNRQRINYSTEDYQRLFVDIFKNADTRKLILFGSGAFTKKFLALYKKDYPVYAIIDNNSTKWGEELDGVLIQSPDILKDFQSGEYKVIICIKNYLSVMKQLDELGVGDYSIYDWNKDYPRRLNPITTVSVSEDTISKRYNIGYVAGVFDMFHVGHVNLLRKAKELCNYLIVGVLADETVYKSKKKWPIISADDRAEVLKACRYADQVEILPLDYAGIRDAYRLFHFDCQFSGDDHGGDEGWINEKEYLNSKGADIVFFQYTEKVSSTKLRAQLKEETK